MRISTKIGYEPLTPSGTSLSLNEPVLAFHDEPTLRAWVPEGTREVHAVTQHTSKRWDASQLPAPSKRWPRSRRRTSFLVLFAASFFFGLAGAHTVRAGGPYPHGVELTGSRIASTREPRVAHVDDDAPHVLIGTSCETKASPSERVLKTPAKKTRALSAPRAEKTVAVASPAAAPTTPPRFLDDLEPSFRVGAP